MIALMNHPSKWICPKLTPALGNGRNNGTAGYQGSGLKGKGATNQQIPLAQATMNLKTESGLSKRTRETEDVGARSKREPTVKRSDKPWSYLGALYLILHGLTLCQGVGRRGTEGTAQALTWTSRSACFETHGCKACL